MDIENAREDLGRRLPAPLRPLAALAFNYRWSWAPDASALLRSVDPARWDMAGENPVRLLQEVSPARLDRLADDPHFIARVGELDEDLAHYLERPPAAHGLSPRHPVAYFCSEFGIHRSLPIYSGGLGVLAGDILKEASDQAIPMVGVGLLYAQGYCRQTLDENGFQREHYPRIDPDRLPAAVVTDSAGSPLLVDVALAGRRVRARVWRVDVGRVPLFLLDSDIAENHPVDRWITNRLYVGERRMRLSQYALLGIGGLRAMRALAIEPEVIHLNEGHAALGPLEMAREAMDTGVDLDQALDIARQRTLFTTHTPVAAGNEVYGPGEVLEVLGGFHDELGIGLDRMLRLARVHPDDESDGFGMTPLALRVSAAANAVSARHGEVSRSMWAELGDAPPIGEVTNGVHLPTWMAPPMRRLLDRYLPRGWRSRAADPAVWAAVDDIPAAELWAVREELRGALIDAVRTQVVADRLARNEAAHLAEAASLVFRRDVLVVGLARRLAIYKRTGLIVSDPERLHRLLGGDRPIQLLVAGKAHPSDHGGKSVGQRIIAAQAGPDSTGRLAFLADYDMGMASQLVAGVDIWLNLPRPPLEASGTSGMKSAMNGGLNVSVLDGWWVEGYDGSNGWAIESSPEGGDEAQDRRDAEALYGLLESEVAPLFYERDDAGIPQGWVRRVRASLRTVGPRFSATRMMEDYLRRYAGLISARGSHGGSAPTS